MYLSIMKPMMAVIVDSSLLFLIQKDRVFWWRTRMGSYRDTRSFQRLIPVQPVIDKGVEKNFRENLSNKISSRLLLTLTSHSRIETFS